MAGTTLIALIIFLLLFFFTMIVIIGWLYANRTPVDVTTVPKVQSTSFLTLCINDDDCDENLSCDPASFYCKLSENAPCTSGSQCAFSNICSGRCTSGPTGGLNQLCPCNNGLRCTPQLNGLTVCKGNGGTPCQRNSDCVSDFCTNAGVCSMGAPNSAQCTRGTECQSEFCSNGFCQDRGVVSGSRGSACAGNCVTFSGARCDRDLICSCASGPNEPGVCAQATQGLLAPCTDSSLCVSALNCLNTTGAICDGETGCICVAPYTNPNFASNNNACIVGMSRFGDQCFNDSGLGCDIGGACFSGNCSGGSVMAVYNFNTGIDPINLGRNFDESTYIRIRPAFSGLPGVIQPKKLFATSASIGGADTIYLVDALQGFNRIIFSPSTNSIVQNWVNLIPQTTVVTVGSTTYTRELIDVAYNGSTWLVAFHETSSLGPSNDTLYTWNGNNLFTVFNPQAGSGLPGTQYTTSNTALDINFISISPANDISLGGDVLITSFDTAFLKKTTETKYSVPTVVGGPMHGVPITNTTGPIQFYYDVLVNVGGTGPAVCPALTENQNIQCESSKNISFVAPYKPAGETTFTAPILQFSGNAASIAFPFDNFNNIEYSVFDYSIFSPTSGQIKGMNSANSITLARVNNTSNFVVSVNTGGVNSILPYRISSTSRSVATINAFYVLSIGSCG